MTHEQREQIEELAESIASDVAMEEDNLMCEIYSRYEAEVEALVDAHGVSAVRDIFDGAFIEYDAPQPNTSADLMEQLFVKKPRTAKAC